MKRFAIQFPDGLFSNGPQCRPVTLDKAKLWRLKNHVSAHLGRFSGNPYPAETYVVEIELSPTSSPLYEVQAYLKRKHEADAIEKAKREKHWAERQVVRAEKDLRAAKGKLRKVNGDDHESTPLGDYPYK